MTLDDKNTILKNLVGGVKIYIICSSSKPNYEYSYMQLKDSSKTAYNIESMTINQLIKAAWKLKTPKWVKLNTVCVDLVGRDVWFNKEHKFTVKAVAISKDDTTVYMTDGTSYTNENLWIKG